MSENKRRGAKNFLMSVVASIVAALLLNMLGLTDIDLGLLRLGNSIGPFLVVLVLLPVAYVLINLAEIIATVVEFIQDFFNLS